MDSPILSNLSEIDIDSLSMLEIEELLPKLQVALEEAKQNRPIYDVVDESFSEVWHPLEHSLKEEFLLNLQKEKEEFVLRESIKVVLKRSIGDQYTKGFFKAVNLCLKEKDFRKTGKFYKTVSDPSSKLVAQVGMVVYRFNKSLTSDDKFLGGKWVKGEIVRVKSITDPKVKSAVDNFSEVGLIPS